MEIVADCCFDTYAKYKSNDVQKICVSTKKDYAMWHEESPVHDAIIYSHLRNDRMLIGIKNATNIFIQKVLQTNM